MRFAERYGPTALVLGASEGIGAAWATQLAQRGLDLVLVARGVDKLDAVAQQIRADHGVQVRTVSLDLGRADLAECLATEFAGEDIGLVVYNACYSVIANFLDLSLADKLTTVDVNVRGPLVTAHVFGPRLAERGRGGLVLMSSMSGFQGSAMVGTYAATKAFDTVLGEALWEELERHGVDVLVCVAGATLTPNFKRQTPESRRSAAMPLEPDQVVREAMARLGSGVPTWIPGTVNRVAYHALKNLPRGRQVRFISNTTRKMYEP